MSDMYDDPRWDEVGVQHTRAVPTDPRIAALENAIRQMIASVPGGTHCDPQEVCDTLRAIAEKHGVRTET